ncbi:hypothetical protein BDF14DRAFT_1739839 [Spinellus fusiger]|nr:hypothetical protein BDF14DRAFT_1739839 [Spinellus fusiger]
MNRQWRSSLRGLPALLLTRHIRPVQCVRAYGGVESIRPPTFGIPRPGPLTRTPQTATHTPAHTPPAPIGRSRRDEEITARFITLVDDAGKVFERTRLTDALRRLDRTKYFLIEVDPTAKPNPVCRMFDKKAVFEKQKASKKKQVTPESILKEITFGWNVSPHDMEHKLGRAIQFLEKGNKVKVEIVNKKGQQRPDSQAQQKLIQQVTEQLNGFRLSKPTAIVSGVCHMQFEK